MLITDNFIFNFTEWLFTKNESRTFVACFCLAPHKFYIGFRYVDPLTESSLEQMER